jgi:hypothetical protein
MKLLQTIGLSLFCWPLALVAQEKFSFIALGDQPYGPQGTAPYRLLIDRINQEVPAFSLHVGDIKSGSSTCSDEEFSAQLEHFQRFAGAVIYTPGDNEWTDCHRRSNGSYDPLERLSVLRKMFFPAGRSLGQKPIATDSQAVLMPAFSKFVENQRWYHRGVLFTTVHLVGSNNNLEARSPAATAEFFERDEANAVWLRAMFEEARRHDVSALVVAFQGDPFEPKSTFEDFPSWSGFKRSIESTLLPLAATWGRPILVIHGDSHNFRIDQPFSWQRQPLRNITRLIVPGAADIRAVRIEFSPPAKFGFQLIATH